MRSALPAIVLLLLGAVPSLAQEKTEPETSVKTRSTSVLVDVVVRDRHGDPLADLQPSDFQVFEDGVPQKINYFQSLSDRLNRIKEEHPAQAGADRPETAEATSRAAAQNLPRMDQPLQGSFTALVFGRLSGTSLKYARDAALQYVTEVASPDTRIGVFVIDLSLRTLQFYTSDQERLQDSVKRATGMATARFYSESEQIRETLKLQEEIRKIEDYLVASNGPQALMSTSPASMMISMHLRMLETFQQLQRDQMGHSTTNGLLALVKSLGLLPGRKSVLFFSEGMAIPPAVVQRFRAITHAANRANVSIYPIDAAGLRVKSTNDETMKEVMALGERRLNELRWDADPTSGPMMRYLEKNEDLIRLDPHSGLNELAESTGGRLIRDTNDLLGGLREIDQDIHSYYLLAYSPSNQNLDGRFRTIEVKVLVPDVRIQYRKGYYAVDTTVDEPLLDYEAPALAALAGGAVDKSLPLRAAVLSFPRIGDRGFVTVLAEVAPGTIHYEPVKDDGEPSFSDFTVVTLVRDRSRKVVRKLSQHYRLARESLNNGDGILFYRELHLDPGEYTFETAGFDAVSARAGISRETVDLRGIDESLPQLSSLMIVNAAERIGDHDRGATTPFHYENLLFYPNLSGYVSKAQNQEMTLFFTVYPGQASAGDAIIEILQDDQQLGRSQVPLPEPIDDGRIQFASSIPVSTYPPGIYTLRVSLPAGGKVISRSRTFLLAP
ncbi:MAG: VWA domain-containing protein [Acidobacteriota bacterium]